MFASATVKARSPAPIRGQLSRAHAFTVKLNTPDGPKTVSSEGDQPILDTAEAADIELPYGCRKGTCGSCLARRESGTLTYGDTTPSFFEDPQLLAKRGLTDIDVGVNGDWILCCQAKPTSDMELRTSPETPILGDPNQALDVNA
eukprot:jgi/Ulvmu1/1162/UM107_0036.1